jgi:hypothetical protein
MLTSGDIEFEPAQTKVLTLTSSIRVLVAGDASFQIEILYKVQQEVNSRVTANPTDWIAVEEIGQMYIRSFNASRFKRAENAILAPLGLDSQSFVVSQQKMSARLVDKLARELLNFGVPDTATIFCGVDNDGAHIYTARGGQISCDDVAGFSAIGAGAWHADSQIMFGEHSKWRTFTDTLHLIYSAKKRSEVAPGVGTATDMFYIGPQVGSAVAIGSHVIDRLDAIYKEEQEAQQQARQKSREQTNAYIEELTQPAESKDQSEIPKDFGGTESPTSEGASDDKPASGQDNEKSKG